MLPSDNRQPRIEVVDALRGFAVAAICLVHNLEHFIFPVYPLDSPTWLQHLDQGVFAVVFALFAGKAYAIFALLFGFTFHIQSENARRRGNDFGYRFLWRLVLLVSFATLNAAFFPAGDVLLLFAVVAPVLFLMRRRSDRAVLAVACILLLQPVEWYHFIASLIDLSHTLWDLRVDELYAQIGDVVDFGSFSDFILYNISIGQAASLLWAVGAGRVTQTAGLFLLGLYIGRKRLFDATTDNLRRWTRILIVSALAFAPLYALKELAFAGDDLVRRSVGTAFDMWQKLAATGILVSSFVLLYRNRRVADALSGLRLYGRMSLTNYIAQSLLGAAIYFPFGLHLAFYCGYTASLAIGAALVLLQIRLCRLWLSRHRRGPLEALWHRWTWLGSKHQRTL